MNERILLLAEQAGYKPLSPPTFADELNEIYMRKFAELIVRECAEYLYTNYPHSRYEVNYMRKHMGDPNWNKPIAVEELHVCKHDWYSAKNPVVLNGSVCLICGAIDPREPEELKND